MDATRIRRRTAVLVSTVAAATVATVGLAAPAFAADLGTLTVTPTSGTITDNPMFATASTSAACPTDYDDVVALKVGRPGGPYNNLRPLSGGDFGAGPFTLAPNRAFNTAVGTSTGSGDWVIVVECAGEILGTNPDRFTLPITVTGNNWQVKGTSTEAAATTTTLTATPAGPVSVGTEVTLTATVSPAAAAGSVAFKDGSSTVATAAVSGGVATAKVSDLAAGSHSLTAAFTPADAAAFKASTSDATTLQVNTEPSSGTNASQEVSVAVVGGGLTLAVPGTPVALTGGTVGGNATGTLNKATVTDARGDNSGWNLVGQATAFAGTPSGSIPANQLGWTPSASKVSGSGTVAAGAAANPGAGLGTARKLCGADSGASAGSFDCNAGLSLGIPDSTAPGTYRSTLTLTLS